MKRLLLVAMLAMSISLTTKAQDNKDKVKKTSTAGQKVHNTFSKHKKHNGYKVKSKHHGVKHKHKVNTQTGEVKNKTDKNK
jgi:ABC-type uncharacterized transport system YnjBCD substrate-binding protein